MAASGTATRAAGQDRQTLARVSLALGVLSLLSFYPILGLIVIPVPIAGVITAVMAMRSPARRFAKAGLGFSLAGLAIDLLWVLAFVFQIGH